MLVNILLSLKLCKVEKIDLIILYYYHRSKLFIKFSELIFFDLVLKCFFSSQLIFKKKIQFREIYRV